MSSSKPPVISTSSPTRKVWLWAFAIAIITLICYAPLFSNTKEFTNWDDDQYITDQPLITSLDAAHVKALFAPGSIVVYNYHPLTMLSLAFDYQRGYDEDSKTVSIAPFVHTNIILHLLNTILVFLLIYHLCRKKYLMPAALAALLFGIHPLHVESVAWMSERKDLLYCCFFLLSCLSYLRFTDTRKWVWLGISWLLFIASCLSKAMAVPLPFVLLLIDYLYQRKITLQVLLEKLPYFIVAVIIGLHTLTAQKGAISDFAAYSILQRFFFAAGAFCSYIFKWIIPINLSAFYPYPQTVQGIPVFYYIAPLLALILLIVPAIYYKRKHPDKLRPLIFGIGFFVLMILLVLPIITVGSAIMAERYSYVSSIGLLFLIPVFLQDRFEQPGFKKVALSVAGIFTIFYAVKTYQRIPVWENSKSLWVDVIHQYPVTVQNGKLTQAGAKVAYKNMADAYTTAGEYDSAFYYLNVLTTAGTKDAEVWSNLADIYVMRKDYPNALTALGKSLAIDSTKSETYLKRAIVFANSNNYPEAIKNLDKVVQLKPDDEQAKGMREKMRKFLK